MYLESGEGQMAKCVGGGEGEKVRVTHPSEKKAGRGSNRPLASTFKVYLSVPWATEITLKTQLWSNFLLSPS